VFFEHPVPMVVGRETTLPSGAVDLVALAKSGDLLIVEFKTGPQNSDFRAALAQLNDYGSDLWRTSLDEFETSVPVRYFASAQCKDTRVRGMSSLADAAKAVWVGLEDDEWTAIIDRLSQQLTSGGFHYVVVSQRFTPTIQRTISRTSTPVSSGSLTMILPPFGQCSIGGVPPSGAVATPMWLLVPEGREAGGP
jgi:hypothetical protein